jgi:hypothetical protein
MKNGRPPTHTDRARQLANELEEMEWDEDSSVTIVDSSGRKMRVRTPSHAEIEISAPSEAPVTKPDNPRPSSVAASAKGAAHVLQNVKSWQHVVALAILAVFAAFAILQGLKLW